PSKPPMPPPPINAEPTTPTAAPMFNSFNWFGSVAVFGICPSLDPQDPVLHWGLRAIARELRNVDAPPSNDRD
ncbi:MAG: hypothetical protein O9331_02870, partial [Acidovorax sp.]|nr:hypothetical protein [Acidovorax sp.]